MVQERIVLGHKVSKKGIEVDKAKLNLISCPSFYEAYKIFFVLGQAGFYRRFTKEESGSASY